MPFSTQEGTWPNAREVARLACLGAFDLTTHGVHLTWGIRRHKFGEWIHSVNLREVNDAYRDRLDDLAAEVTLFLDQITFGKIVRHMDPDPTPQLNSTAADIAEGVQATPGGQMLRPVLRGVLHINCQSCGAPHRIDLDEDGVHIVLGAWNVTDNPVDE